MKTSKPLSFTLSDVDPPDAGLTPRTSLAPALHFEHLGVRMGQCDILEDVCARVPSGSSTVLIGPNGAGKTTLLHCLLGQIPYQGRIDVTGPPAAHRLRIGFVPQHLRIETGLPLLVVEFLALGLQRRPLWLGLARQSRTQALTALRLAQAEGLAARRLEDLSGGELRRVLLAGALARKPHLLILDEPDAGVDVQGERLLWETLHEIRQQLNFTQLMVSHNLPLAARYASHIICLNRRIIAQGQPRTALTADVLLALFGAPIHLYPEQCDRTESFPNDADGKNATEIPSARAWEKAESLEHA